MRPTFILFFTFLLKNCYINTAEIFCDQLKAEVLYDYHCPLGGDTKWSKKIFPLKNRNRKPL